MGRIRPTKQGFAKDRKGKKDKGFRIHRRIEEINDKRRERDINFIESQGKKRRGEKTRPCKYLLTKADKNAEYVRKSNKQPNM